MEEEIVLLHFHSKSMIDYRIWQRCLIRSHIVMCCDEALCKFNQEDLSLLAFPILLSLVGGLKSPSVKLMGFDPW